MTLQFCVVHQGTSPSYGREELAWANLQEDGVGRSFACYRTNYCLVEENGFLHVVGPVPELQVTFDGLSRDRGNKCDRWSLRGYSLDQFCQLVSSCVDMAAVVCNGNVQIQHLDVSVRSPQFKQPRLQTLHCFRIGADGASSGAVLQGNVGPALTITLTWHASKCKVHKLHHRCIRKKGCPGWYIYISSISGTLGDRAAYVKLSYRQRKKHVKLSYRQKKNHLKLPYMYRKKRVKLSYRHRKKYVNLSYVHRKNNVNLTLQFRENNFCWLKRLAKIVTALLKTSTQLPSSSRPI